MLWKKESKKSDALYVDFLRMASAYDYDFDERMNPEFPSFISHMVYQPPTVKTDSVSTQTRTYGNYSFGSGNLMKAIEWYNDSLCLAPAESKNIPFAYANRASCFLKLKMYDECLADIELAKAAGYPVELMSKLNQRKENCLKEMEKSKGETKRSIETVNFEANKNFPSMANVLRVKKDNSGTYSVFANQDIDIGQTVVAEKALFGCPFPKASMRCSVCLKRLTNLIPCKKCTRAMFCSAACESSRLHELECEIKFFHNEIGVRIMAIVRTVVSAINLFSNADELMHFIEQTRQSGARLPATMTDAKSQYHAYIKQKLCADNFDGSEIAGCIAPIYKKVMSVPSIKQMFKSKKHERFLQHLIGNHSLIAGELIQINQ